jgi:hypothetical protein
VCVKCCERRLCQAEQQRLEGRPRPPHRRHGAGAAEELWDTCLDRCKCNSGRCQMLWNARCGAEQQQRYLRTVSASSGGTHLQTLHRLVGHPAWTFERSLMQGEARCKHCVGATSFTLRSWDTREGSRATTQVQAFSFGLERQPPRPQQAPQAQFTPTPGLEPQPRATATPPCAAGLYRRPRLLPCFAFKAPVNAFCRLRGCVPCEAGFANAANGEGRFKPPAPACWQSKVRT